MKKFLLMLLGVLMALPSIAAPDDETSSELTTIEPDTYYHLLIQGTDLYLSTGWQDYDSQVEALSLGRNEVYEQTFKFVPVADKEDVYNLIGFDGRAIYTSYWDCFWDDEPTPENLASAEYQFTVESEVGYILIKTQNEYLGSDDVESGSKLWPDKGINNAVKFVPELFVPAQDFSYKYDGQTVGYTIIDEEAKTCKVAAFNDIQGDLTLPTNPKNGEVEYTLVEIGKCAFRASGNPQASKLTTIVLPATIKSIGNYAFEGQGELYEIDFPDGLEEIGDYAFHDCKLLEFFGFPESLLKIGEYAFWNCNAQTSIVLPPNIQSLGKGAFREMAKLKKAVLFSDLDTVPEELCAGCSSLEALYLPQQVKVIGDFSFLNTNIDEVILPNTLEIIGLASFAVSSNYYYPDINRFIAHISISDREYWDIYRLPGDFVDYDCTKLTKINFPESLKEIHAYAFLSHPFFKLEFNEGLKKIEDGAFLGNRLSSLSLPSTIEEIGDYAFNLHHSTSPSFFIGSVTFPSSLRTLGKEVFNFEENGSSYVTIGSLNTGTGLTELNVTFGAFIRYLNIGANVKSLSPKDVFASNVPKVLKIDTQKPPTVSEEFPMTEDEVDNMLVIVKDGTKDLYLRNPYWKVFGNSIVEESEADITIYVDGQYPISEEIRIQSGKMPSQVLKMKVNGKLSEGDWRLIRENMTSLISLDLSGISNTEIPDGAFQGMSLLTEIVLPAKTSRIGSNAFNGCLMLNLSELPEGIKTIGERAFENCQCITISKLPAALEALGESALLGCSSISSLTAGPNLESLGGACTCSGLEYVDLSTSKIKMLGNTFANCSNLTTILLPESLESLADAEYWSVSGALEGTALVSIEIPAKVKSIGNKAFKNTNLRGVSIPEGIETIGEGTFADCPKLININFPQSLTGLGSEVFSNDNKLTSISCRAINAPAAQEGAFNNMNRKRCGLTIPQQSFRSYLNAPGWGGFQNIINRLEVEFPEEDVDLTAIDEEEYQEIVEEEQLQQEAEESAQGDEENPEDNPDQPTPQKMRAKARQQLINGTNFSRLFNGATVATPNTAKGTRVFVNMKYDAEFIALYYNDVDVTAQMEGNSYLLPAKADGKLSLKIKPSGIEDATPDTKGIDYSEPYEVYNLSGACLGNNIDAVATGFYIVRQGAKACKVMKN